MKKGGTFHILKLIFSKKEINILIKSQEHLEYFTVEPELIKGKWFHIRKTKGSLREMKTRWDERKIPIENGCWMTRGASRLNLQRLSQSKIHKRTQVTGNTENLGK